MGILDQLGQQFQPWSSPQTSIIAGENMHSDLSSYYNASHQCLFSHTSPMYEIVLHHMYLEPTATVLSLPEGLKALMCLSLSTASCWHHRWVFAQRWIPETSVHAS